MNKEFGISLIICIIFTLGTYLEIPPFSSYLGFSASIKDEAAIEYGNPPYGHAELSSLKTFAKKSALDLEQSIVLLNENGVIFENSDETLLSIASKNKMSPQAIYNLMLQAKIITATASLPDEHPSGLGNRTIADLCSEYDLNIKKVTAGLKDAGLIADAGHTFKEIATSHDLSPFEVYEKIQAMYTN